MTPKETIEDKILTFEVAIDKGRVFIWVDKQYPGVVIPDHLLTNESPFVVLMYSRTFQLPVFKWDNTGVTAVLSFRKENHPTFIPWGAIRLMEQNSITIGQWEPTTANEDADAKWTFQGVAEA